MSVAGDEQRNFFLQVAAIEKDHFLRRCAEQVTGFKAHSERRSGDFGDKHVALRKPCHVATVNRLGPSWRSASRAESSTKWRVSTTCPIASRIATIWRAVSTVERSPATVNPK